MNVKTGRIILFKIKHSQTCTSKAEEEFGNEPLVYLLPSSQFLSKKLRLSLSSASKNAETSLKLYSTYWKESILQESLLPNCYCQTSEAQYYPSISKTPSPWLQVPRQLPLECCEGSLAAELLLDLG